MPEMQTTVTTPPAAPVPTTSRFDNSLPAAALVAVMLLGLVAVVFLIWRNVEPSADATTDRYAPAPNGAALTYRIVNTDGSVTYRSRNLTRVSAASFVSQLGNNGFNAMLSAAGIDVLKVPTADVLSRLSNLSGVLLHDIESDAQGNSKTATKTYALILNNNLAQFGVNDIGISPPIPLLPEGISPQIIDGTLNEQIPYQLTQEIDLRGSHPTALGELPDCVRVRSKLTFNDTTSENRTWYCAGVGEVADEFTDANGTRRSEIIAASVGSFIRGSTPFLPQPDSNAALEFNYPKPLQGTLIRLLDYKESADSLGITTKILPVGSRLLYGTQSGALVALDRTNQTELWRFQTGASIFSTPVVVNGIVYFGSADKRAYAVRVSDGAFIWAYPTQDILSAALAISNNTAYVASEDRTLYALDADTGRLRWTFTSGSALNAPPVPAGDKLFVSNSDGGLYALDQATGQIIWDFAAGSAITAPVVLAENVVYFGSYDQTVYALNAADGKLNWSQLLNNYVREPVIIADGRVLVQLPTEVFALDAATGNRLWRFNNRQPLYGAPLRFGNQLWLLRTNSLFALDTANGTVTYDVPTTNASTYTGLSSNGREIYIGYFDGALLGFVGLDK